MGVGGIPCPLFRGKHGKIGAVRALIKMIDSPWSPGKTAPGPVEILILPRLGENRAGLFLETLDLVGYHPQAGRGVACHHPVRHADLVGQVHQIKRGRQPAQRTGRLTGRIFISFTGVFFGAVIVHGWAHQ